MKFEDLNFEEHEVLRGDAKKAFVEFNNGYGASVVSGKCFYTSEKGPYELAVMKDGNVCYSTPITDDIIGKQTADEISALLVKIEALPNEGCPA